MLQKIHCSFNSSTTYIFYYYYSLIILILSIQSIHCPLSTINHYLHSSLIYFIVDVVSVRWNACSQLQMARVENASFKHVTEMYVVQCISLHFCSIFYYDKKYKLSYWWKISKMIVCCFTTTWKHIYDWVF